MFMQQFCGVNVIAYYSTQVFLDSGFDTTQAFLASFGFGCSAFAPYSNQINRNLTNISCFCQVNFLFAIPAVYTIDTFGRRNLLLTTFPLMSLFLLMTGFSFFIPERNAQLGVVALGIYLFGIVYSPGEGPVPFTVRFSWLA